MSTHTGEMLQMNQNTSKIMLREVLNADLNLLSINCLIVPHEQLRDERKIINKAFQLTFVNFLHVCHLKPYIIYFPMSVDNVN